MQTSPGKSIFILNCITVLFKAKWIWEAFSFLNDETLFLLLFELYLP